MTNEPQTEVGKFSKVRVHLFFIVRVLAGIILLLAAIGKTYKIASGLEHDYATYFGIRWLAGYVIAVEFLIAFWMLSGLAKHLARWVSIILFTAFSLISLSKLLNGDANCGCFGTVTVPTGWVFGIDLCFALLLIFSKPSKAPLLQRRDFRGGLLLFGIWVIVLTGASAMVKSRIFYQSNIRVITANSWNGKELPIIDEISFQHEVELSNGQWIIVLYRSRCPLCADLDKKTQILSEKLSELGLSIGIAVLEVPPYANEPMTFRAAHHGKLQEDRTWIVPTPMVFELDEGIVRSGYRGIQQTTPKSLPKKKQELK